MARYVVPVVVLLAMVGGYVAGQQVDALPGAPGEKVEDGLPSDSPRETLIVDLIAKPEHQDAQPLDPLPGEPGEKVEDGLPRPSGDNFRLVWDQQAAVRQRDAGAPVGRYVPFEGGRMLDTTNGTLYAMSGEGWRAVLLVGNDQSMDAAPKSAATSERDRDRAQLLHRLRDTLKAADEEVQISLDLIRKLEQEATVLQQGNATR